MFPDFTTGYNPLKFQLFSSVVLGLDITLYRMLGFYTDIYYWVNCWRGKPNG